MRRTIPDFPPYKKVDVVSFVELKLRQDDDWAMKGCMAIFNQMSPKEQKKHLACSGHDGLGFSRNDAPLLSTIACDVKLKRHTREQIDSLHRKMPRYAKQLICISKPACLLSHLDKYYKYKRSKMPF